MVADLAIGEARKKAQGSKFHPQDISLPKYTLLLKFLGLLETRPEKNYLRFTLGQQFCRKDKRHTSDQNMGDPSHVKFTV